MTLPNRITLIRILLIPVFVLFAVYYGKSVSDGAPEEWLRWAVVLVFLIASASDGLDGWLARKFGQRTRLGAILDPLADKGLLITAIITLSVSKWTIGFPLWFPVLVIARDAVIVSGCLVLKYLDDHLDVRPTWTGKLATALQMAAVAWVMLQIPWHLPVVVAAGALTLVSGGEYVARGVSLFRAHDSARHGKPGAT